MNGKVVILNKPSPTVEVLQYRLNEHDAKEEKILLP
jgi:hypothetical protein